MDSSNKKFSFKHEIGLRFLKTINLLLMVFAFAVAWFWYYDQLTVVPYLWRGDVAIITFFAVLYYLFGKTYDAFLISHYRIFDIVASQSLAVLFSDGLMYVVMFFLAKRLVNPLPLMLIFADQVAFSIIWTYFAHIIYFKWFPARKSIIIFDQRRGMTDLIEEYGLAKKFEVKKTATVEECLNDLSMIDDMDVVFLSGIHSHDRNIILKYCL